MLQYYMWFLYFCLQSAKEFFPPCFIPLGTSLKKKSNQKTPPKHNKNPWNICIQFLHSNIICVYPLICHFVELGLLLASLFCNSSRFLMVSFIMVLRYLKQIVVKDWYTENAAHACIVFISRTKSLIFHLALWGQSTKCAYIFASTASRKNSYQ